VPHLNADKSLKKNNNNKGKRKTLKRPANGNCQEQGRVEMENDSKLFFGSLWFFLADALALL